MDPFRKEELQSERFRLESELRDVSAQLERTEARAADLKYAGETQAIRPEGDWSDASHHSSFIRRAREESELLRAECERLKSQRSNIISQMHRVDNFLARS